MIHVSVECPSCLKSLSTVDFIAACSRYSAAVDAVCFTCPHCHCATDARIRDSCISLGYIYAAGSFHFCGMVEIATEELTVQRDGDTLLIEHQGKQIRVNS